MNADRPLVAVLDYGIGNLRSAQKALERVGADAHLTADRGLIAEAAGVVLPGVGAFGRCMEALTDVGLDVAAKDAAASGRPFLGICVGLQLLYEGSQENPDVAGLGILSGQVRLLPAGVKRPQMQWNRLDLVGGHPLLAGLRAEAWVYFVHSYFPRPDDPDTVLATAEYGASFACVVGRGRTVGIQFHPEKSQKVGLTLLENFLKLNI